MDKNFRRLLHEITTDKDTDRNTLHIFIFLMTKLDIDIWRKVTLSEIAESCSVSQLEASRSVRFMSRKNYLLSHPQKGFRINFFYTSTE